MPTMLQNCAHGKTAAVLLALAGAAAIAGVVCFNVQAAASGQTIDPWPRINLNVVALDKSGSSYPNAPASEFRILEDNADRPIESVGAPDAPISAAFVIDTSGSMYRQQPAISAIVTAVAQALPPRSEIMAIEFSEQPHVEQVLAPAAGNDLSVLRHLDARGGTAVLDAVIETESLLAKQAHYPRRALILVGDGGDNCSTHSIDEASRALQRPGAPSLYSFVLTPIVRNGTNPAEQGERVMKSLVRMSGAVVFSPHKERDFAPAITALVAAVRSQYVVTFNAADASRDGSRHTLEVRLPVRNLSIYGLPSFYAPEN